MFKGLLIIGFVFSAMTLKASDGQKVTSKVQKVIVFLNGAQVTRSANVNISEGTSILVFEKISPNIDVRSIQVHAGGNFTILSVKNETNYLGDESQGKNLEELHAHQRVLIDKLQARNDLLLINAEEENMLSKNQVVTGENASLDVLKLQQALDFQTKRLTIIKSKKSSINKEIGALNAELQKYNQQIADIENKNGKTTNNILVTVSSKAPLQSEFTLSYLVNNAGWYPTYDIRAKNVNSPIGISYKANISQQSGEDWKNIKLTLSTGNPSVNGIKPELNPYFLNLNTNYIGSADKSYGLNEVSVVGYSSVRRSGSVSVSRNENQTNVEFNIDEPYSVPSDGKQYTAEINQFNVNAEYQYAVAPKMGTNVFLTAKVTDWSKYDLLPGEANLFFEGTFIGKSSINTNTTTDTLNLSLGIDKNIVVSRILRKEFTQRQSIGSNKKDTKDWLIEIKNRKNQPINLLVEDQVPVSQNSAIEVENQELSGGTLDPNTGKVSWTLTLSPQKEKKLELKYQVKYPKNQTIIVQ